MGKKNDKIKEAFLPNWEMCMCTTSLLFTLIHIWVPQALLPLHTACKSGELRDQDPAKCHITHGSAHM